MLENLIGKDCSAVVAFGNTAYQVLSTEIKGVLESFDDEYICLKTKKGKSLIAIKALIILNVLD